MYLTTASLWKKPPGTVASGQQLKVTDNERLNRSRSQGWVSSLKTHFVRGDDVWSRTQLSQPSFQIFCRFREGRSASTYVIHILGRFPSQLKGFFLLPKPLLQAGAQPGEVARTEGRPWALRVWHTALSWVQENEAATCLRAGEVEEAQVEVKKRRISAVLERWECVRAMEIQTWCWRVGLEVV